MAVLDEGGRKLNEECDRLGISRVIEIDGETVLYHPDGSYTPIPDPDDREVAGRRCGGHHGRTRGDPAYAIPDRCETAIRARNDAVGSEDTAQRFRGTVLKLPRGDGVRGNPVMENGSEPSDVSGCIGRTRHFPARPGATPALFAGQRGATAQARGNRMQGHDHPSGRFGSGLAGTGDFRVAAGNFALFA